jgi:enamine deaminase RidA (YjgF/YER057c/UK114 family)
MLNEAYDYDKPVPFSRGTRIELKGVTLILLSGTASVNEKGESVHVNDFEAQAKRMLDNATALLTSEQATWHDVVRTTFYVKDIEAHYHALSAIRMAFFKKQGIKAYPASTCVEAKLCRPELLVEMEVMALMEKA